MLSLFWHIMMWWSLSSFHQWKRSLLIAKSSFRKIIHLSPKQTHFKPWKFMIKKINKQGAKEKKKILWSFFQLLHFQRSLESNWWRNCFSLITKMNNEDSFFWLVSYFPGKERCLEFLSGTFTRNDSISEKPRLNVWTKNAFVEPSASFVKPEKMSNLFDRSTTSSLILL